MALQSTLFALKLGPAITWNHSHKISQLRIRNIIIVHVIQQN